jgi:hypothetical protein
VGGWVSVRSTGFGLVDLVDCGGSATERFTMPASSKAAPLSHCPINICSSLRGYLSILFLRQ